jgi:hypothetical protein
MYPAPGPVTEVLQVPSVDMPAEAELGGSMVSFSKQLSMPAIRTTQPVTTREMGIQLTIPAGLLYLKGSNSDGKFYEYAGDVRLISLGVSLPNSKAGVFIPNDPSQQNFSYRYMAFGLDLKPVPQVVFSPAVYVENEAVSFRVEFIYTGVANNILTATYREYRDDMARPAFSQELKYDISQDKVIGFKGARVQVLSAGNVSIKYVVQKGFDQLVF